MVYWTSEKRKERKAIIRTNPGLALQRDEVGGGRKVRKTSWEIRLRMV